MPRPKLTRKEEESKLSETEANEPVLREVAGNNTRLAGIYAVSTVGKRLPYDWQGTDIVLDSCSIFDCRICQLAMVSRV